VLVHCQNVQCRHLQSKQLPDRQATLRWKPVSKDIFNGDGLLVHYLRSVRTTEGDSHDGHRIRTCIRGQSRHMDQLFSLGHVSGTTKNSRRAACDRIGYARNDTLILRSPFGELTVDVRFDMASTMNGRQRCAADNSGSEARAAVPVPKTREPRNRSRYSVGPVPSRDPGCRKCRRSLKRKNVRPARSPRSYRSVSSPVFLK
jgi:hypothetical protein